MLLMRIVSLPLVASALLVLAGCSAADETSGEQGSAAVVSSVLSFEPRGEDRGAYSPANAAWLARASIVGYQNRFDQKNTIRALQSELAVDGRAMTFTAFRFFATKDDSCTYFATDRAAFLVFRGTDSWRDWVTNLKVTKTDGVHSGFRGAFDALWTGRGLESSPIGLKEFIAKHHDRNVPLYITGHSLGAALATLAVDGLIDAKVPVYASYTFASPRVGDAAFADELATKSAAASTKIFRVVNQGDMVSVLPPSIPLVMDYKHVARTSEPDTEGNPRFVFLPDEAKFLVGTSKGGHDLVARLSSYAVSFLEEGLSHSMEAYKCKLNRIVDPNATCAPASRPTASCEALAAAYGNVLFRSTTSGGCAAAEIGDATKTMSEALDCRGVIGVRDPAAFERCLPAATRMTCSDFKSATLPAACRDPFTRRNVLSPR